MRFTHSVIALCQSACHKPNNWPMNVPCTVYKCIFGMALPMLIRFPQGPMTGIVGSVWSMRDNLTDIAWTARTPLQEAAPSIDDPLLSLSWERRMRDALAADLNSVLPSASDVYSFGKEISRMARLALIADELGECCCSCCCCRGR